MFRERAEKRKIALRLDTAKGLEVEADRRALEQVLTNLVDNAVKYCPEGCAVTLRAERTDGPVPGVRLRVEDDGIGIEEKHLPRLFERFYRVDAGRSREMGGTGLGLSIVKHLVEAMAGTIDVISVVGKGTTFDMKIPDASTRGREKSSSDDIARDAKEDAA
jgi:two-component system phosphate regulon sensor histidine kinase PhoR